MAVDDEEDSPEAAAQRKQARKDRRETNRLKKGGAPNSMDGSPDASRASTEEIETPKKRGRKPGSKNEKRKAEDGDDEPPPKKRRGPQGRPSKGGANESRLSPQQRELLQKSLRSLYDGLMTLEVEDIEPPAEDDESDAGKRLIIGPFIKLPPRRDYADYFVIITNPICMNHIQTRIKKEDYNALSDLKRDFDLMIRNCQTYNEDGSILYQDAKTMNDFFVKKYQEQLYANPVLQELEEGGKATSVAPSAAESTPQPSGTRIKIITSSAREANGARSAAQSDEE